MTGKIILLGMGGTGARVVEAALMLASAGVGPSALHVALIDADGAHGNGERTAQALARYHRFRQIWADGGPHYIDHNAPDAPLLGRNAVEPLLPQGRWQWSPPPDMASLSALSEGVPPSLLDALFLPNAREAGRQVQHGLNGQAHVGAAFFGAAFAHPANPLVRVLREAMADGAQIMILGSAFGGTGAGATMALYHILARQTAGKGAIRAMLLPPYFDYGDDEVALTVRTQTALHAAEGAGLPLLPMESHALLPLPTHGRSGRAQCNPAMPDELVAAARILAHLTGEAVTPFLDPRVLGRMHHAIRMAHFTLYETQVRLRAKAGLFSGNWAMALAGKVPPDRITEPANLLTDVSRRWLEWAGSVEAMARLSDAPDTLSWRIAPASRDVMPVTGAPRQGVQMTDPAAIATKQAAMAFDGLITDGAPYPPWATVLGRLRRKPPIGAGHRGLGRVLAAQHAAIGSEGGTL